jgi:hypothetical protein
LENRGEKIMGKLTPIEKLTKRIEKEFDSKKLLGDIQISDEEYSLLIDYLCRIHNRASTSYHYSFNEKLFVVGIIQIAINDYDGGLWTHIISVMGVKDSGSFRKFITESFLNSLRKYNKLDRSNEEFFHNVMMHILVCDHYINKLFRFIYSYYQIDLERNLSLNTKEMMNALISNIIDRDSNENDNDVANREYMLNKHTIDAIRANTKSAKMKIRWILRLMDKAFWNNILPDNPKGMLSQLFVQWVNETDVFRDDVRQYSNKDYGNRKQFRTPVLQVNFNRLEFSIYIPGQTLLYRDVNRVLYSMVINGYPIEWSPECIASRAGYKISEDNKIIELSDVFNDIHLSIFVNGEKIRSFNVIQSSDYVKFDKFGFQTNRLRQGEMIIIAKRGKLPYHSSINKQPMVGAYEMAHYTIDEDDFIVDPDGKHEFVEMSHANRISNKGIVRYASCDGEIVYNKIPPIFFSTKKSRLEGSRISVNGNWRRLIDLNVQIIDNAIDEDLDSDFVLELTESDGVIIGVNILTFDIPNDNKYRDYSFAYLPNLSFDLVGSPYFFVESAVIEFDISLLISSEYEKKGTNTYLIKIDEQTDKLEFEYITKNSRFDFMIEMPIFRWGFDKDHLNTHNLGDCWIADFNFKLFIDTPVDFRFEVEQDENYQHLDIKKSAVAGLIECDLTRMRSWLSKERVFHDVFIVTESNKYKFGRIFVQTKVTSIQPLHWNEVDMTINGGISVIGKDPLFISITHVSSDRKIVDMDRLADESFSYHCDGLHGNYQVDILKKIKGFGGSGYETIFSKISQVVTDNLSGIDFYIRSHRFQEQKIFLEFYDYRYLITDFERVGKGVYSGKLSEKPLQRAFLMNDEFDTLTFLANIEVRFIRDKDYSNAEIMAFDEDGDYLAFLYDVKQRRLVLIEDFELESRDRYTRYKALFDQMTIFELELK